MQLGNIFIISAPSGAGKTSLIKALLELRPDLELSISYTTRAKRDIEVDGKDYFFVSKNKFDSMLAENKFLESALVFGNYYGTGTDWLTKKLNKGTDIILELDWQGAEQVVACMPKSRVTTIFIAPPDIETLQERLIYRGVDSSKVVESRMSVARNELSNYHKYEYVVINNNFDSALSQINSIVSSVYNNLYKQKDYYKSLLSDLL